MELSKEDKELLMCAFEASNKDCKHCSIRNKCYEEPDKSFYAMGQDLLIKMGIIEKRMIDWHNYNS